MIASHTCVVGRRKWLPIYVILATLLAISLAQNENATSSLVAQNHGNYTTVSQAFPPLANLTRVPTYINGPTHNPYKGGQNFTHCCLLAINESLSLNSNGFIIQNPNSYIFAVINKAGITDPVAALFYAQSEGQFPCGAVFNGDKDGSPVIVRVSYGWVQDTCPGWELSDSQKGDESQWISPLVGFLLPAVVFCGTIPRRRKLAVWDKFFIYNITQFKFWLFAPFSITIAGCIMITDTVVWLCMCFTFAGPMLLSGLFEGFLDNHIIRFLEEKTKNCRLTLDMRARLLFVVLCGNLDLNVPEDPDLTIGITEHMILHYPPEERSERWPDENVFAHRKENSPWTHIENLLHRVRSYRDSKLGTPRQWPRHDKNCENVLCMDRDCAELPLKRDSREIFRTQTQLKAMMAAQLSFGTTVGAPVVFFLGSFAFTIVTTLADLGDEDTSLALAFGMWYMIIPHISIVSGLLLAGNNPNALEGVVAGGFRNNEEEEEHFITTLFELEYDSIYRPQWLWLRGRSKRDWVQKVLKTYKYRPHSSIPNEIELDTDMQDLKEATTLKITEWILVVGMAVMLLGIPFVLAFLTGFYTPQVGLSCRSFTFTIYFISQICQMTLWIWAYAGAPERGPAFFKKGGYLDRHGFFTPTSLRGREGGDCKRTKQPYTIFSKEHFLSLPTLWAGLWYFQAILYGCGAVLSAIGGTMMQLMGVYTAGLCDVNAEWWTRPQQARNILFIISSNYALEIKDANRYWVNNTVAAMIFLGFVSFCGWWYQRRLRGIFKGLVKNLGNEKFEREDVRAAWRLRGSSLQSK